MPENSPIPTRNETYSSVSMFLAGWDLTSRFITDWQDRWLIRQDVEEVRMTQGFSKGLIIVGLGLIAALTLVMAFAPAGSIYQG